MEFAGRERPGENAGHARFALAYVGGQCAVDREVDDAFDDHFERAYALVADRAAASGLVAHRVGLLPRSHAGQVGAQAAAEDAEVAAEPVVEVVLGAGVVEARDDGDARERLGEVVGAGGDQVRVGAVHGEDDDRDAAVGAGEPVDELRDLFGADEVRAGLDRHGPVGGAGRGEERGHEAGGGHRAFVEVAFDGDADPAAGVLAAGGPGGGGAEVSGAGGRLVGVAAAEFVVGEGDPGAAAGAFEVLSAVVLDAGPGGEAPPQPGSEPLSSVSEQCLVELRHGASNGPAHGHVEATCYLRFTLR